MGHERFERHLEGGRLKVPERVARAGELDQLAREAAGSEHDERLIPGEEDYGRGRSRRRRAAECVERRIVRRRQRVRRAFAGTIPLLVTDMIMPGMNGRALAESLRDSWPRMKVLYISGYTENVLDLQCSFGPGTAFLQKPFTPAVLAQKVRELLDRAA